MGNAFVAVADDASSVFWNAAGLARIEPDKSQLSLNHANWIADMSFDEVGYVFHVKRIPGAFALSARALSMSPMVETTAYQPDPTTGTGRTFDAGMMTADSAMRGRSPTSSARASRPTSSTKAWRNSRSRPMPSTWERSTTSVSWG